MHPVHRCEWLGRLGDEEPVGVWGASPDDEESVGSGELARLHDEEPVPVGIAEEELSRNRILDPRLR
jgi:hypothetical protein